MDFSRRRFLSGSAWTVGAFGVMATPLANGWISDPFNQSLNITAYRGHLAILQSLTTSNSAQFIVLTERDKQYGYQVFDSAAIEIPVRILRREVRKHSKWGIEKLMVANLLPAGEYLLRVIDPDSGQVVDERNFATSNPLASKGKFVIASCMKDNKEEAREIMWDRVAETNPDIVFMIGDTCYADNGLDSDDEKGYWARYVETRNLLSHFRQKRLVPTYATWDDHDFGGNNFDSTFRLKDTTKSLFETFWHPEVFEGMEKGPGISNVLSAFGQRFFLMDCRYFRSSRQESTNAVQWGTQQEEFLFSRLALSKDPAWLMNGSQFFGGYLKKDAFEYWQGQNLKNICSQLAQIEAPVGFASGDVHFSELMNIEKSLLGYSTFEITSSSIHSSSFVGMHLRAQNDRRIDATSVHNFVVVDAENKPEEGWSVRARCYGKSLKKHFDHEFIVKR
ncbi:MAG: phosphodiesterase [Pseudobdellovibrionaceae bacterium]